MPQTLHSASAEIARNRHPPHHPRLAARRHGARGHGHQRATLSGVPVLQGITFELVHAAKHVGEVDHLQEDAMATVLCRSPGERCNLAVARCEEKPVSH
ncbi:MAG: hypothetical protein AB7H71_11035 [Alphaproteobacteria bacterium]